MAYSNPTPRAFPRWFGLLPRYLTRPEAPFSYIVKSWLLTLLPSMALAALVNVAAPAAEGPAINIDSTRLILMLVIGAPLIETAIMLVPLLVFNRLFGPGPAVVLSAAGWAIAHSAAAPIWGLVVWWPFLIFSIILLVWRQRSLVAGFFIVSAVHALQNGVGAVLLFAMEPAAAPAS